MESDNSWSSLFSSSSSRRYQSRSGHFSQTTPDLFAHEETDGDDELKAEFLCPFCAEDFDVVGLCCHIDEEHPVEAKNGVCPVCAKRVGANLVSHITTQHGSLLKISFDYVQRKRKFRRGSNSTFSLLRKELREGSLQALLGGSSFLVSSNTEADPLLSSFIYNPPTVDEDVSAQPHPLVETSFVKESTKEEFSERTVQQPPLSHKDQEEKGRKCEFVQGLLMSTILDDL
ncbi:protein DEHYDRATION-INDUCED 19 homolog 4-like [Prunus yedoensis var. nudiflora]|uniref:Protein DEHYDRATION-INDUCED 19 homolog 4-like n=1 Tax=Prunus yedoensis var. nudiflora TaxID=2094558 RepID=A0A314Z588_PRUYE|nr:protein DEHYDRATION-INDUCED 19 homolog 4-like [Prunus yedoensis var. nudiflora]